MSTTITPWLRLRERPVCLIIRFYSALSRCIQTSSNKKGASTLCGTCLATLEDSSICSLTLASGWSVSFLSCLGVLWTDLYSHVYSCLKERQVDIPETSSNHWRNENRPILALLDGCCSVAEIGSKDTFKAKLKTVSRKNLTSSIWSKVRWSVASRQSFSSQRQSDSS